MVNKVCVCGCNRYLYLFHWDRDTEVGSVSGCRWEGLGLGCDEGWCGEGGVLAGCVSLSGMGTACGLGMGRERACWFSQNYAGVGEHIIK